MKGYTEKVDDYIDKSADFAKPILKKLRSLIHATCPNVEEAIKWSFPNFLYRGNILCSMASFKNHCSFTFWLGSLMQDSQHILEQGAGRSAMGHLGQVKSLDQLPADDVLATYIKQAMQLNEAGVKLPKKVSAPKIVEPPSFLIDELKKNSTAHSYFEQLSPSHKKEYIEWITEAKTEVTRTKRVNATIEMLASGKSLNWKYKNC